MINCCRQEKFQDYFVLNQIKSLEKAKSSGHFVQAASMLHPTHNREEIEVGTFFYILTGLLVRVASPTSSRQGRRDQEAEVQVLNRVSLSCSRARLVLQGQLFITVVIIIIVVIIVIIIIITIFLVIIIVITNLIINILIIKSKGVV